ncbi:unnamed protein product [Peniophora sp. CBMAI 1063]|nr:unnamed protein product [Peniophora sp. CBMAI 1063]
MRRAARLPSTALRHASHSTPSASSSSLRLASTSASPLQPLSGELGPHMTFMPPPLPEDSRKGMADTFFPDTAQQDLRAVMNACLHAGYDVRRALAIFDEMRSGEGRVEVAAYNRVIAACLDMIEREPHKAVVWLDDALEYIRILHDGSDGVAPSAGTYALALQAWVMYGQNAKEGEEVEAEGEGVGKLQSDVYLRPKEVLRGIVRHDLAVEEVVSDHRIADDGVASEMLRTLLRVAAKDNAFKGVAERLVQADEIARHLQQDSLENVPDVKPVEIQATGPSGSASTVPFNLQILRDHLTSTQLFKRLLPADQMARQLLLERSVLDIAGERLRKLAEQFEKIGLDKNARKSDESIQRWMWDWNVKLVERLKKDIRAVRREEDRAVGGSDKDITRVAPFLELLKPEKLALITILEIMRLHGTGGIADGMKTARALLVVGKAVESEYKAEVSRKYGLSVPSLGPSADGTRFSYADLHKRRVAARLQMTDAEQWTDDWSQIVRVRVGAFCVYRLMEEAKVERVGRNKATGEEVVEYHPAFSHGYEYFRGFKLGTIKLNPLVSERIAKDNVRETLHPRHLPMLVEPKPWTDWNSGGYYTIQSHIMRFKDSQEQKALLQKAVQEGKMEQVFFGLNALGATPWRINRPLFDVVLEVWNSGERMGKIPPSEFDGPPPEKPANAETDPHARMAYLARAKKYAQDKAANHSDRCSVNYKIEIARAFLDDVFYLPHNLDFRGRAYPLPPHLNHMGNDLSRGLLLFATAKPLGERGLRWLKIHLANLYGYDKATFDERVAWVDERIEQIMASAKNPLGPSEHESWWKHADDPWQCLSTCMQLSNALNSPDPLAYECPLPVHQDGTCNGLQHYAALGGDAQGARQVNLDVAERPSDVYTYVANMVEKRIEEDLQSEDARTRRYAELLHGRIARKVVKQTVMTTVYGVTFIGAREQIEKQLRERGELPAEEVYMGAAYLARQVLSCIGDLFQGANEIMRWLTMSARAIAKSVPGERLPHALSIVQPSGTWKNAKKKSAFMRVRKEQMGAVVWTTLLGLPIAQPYRKVKRKQIQTSVQSVFISDPNIPAEVNAKKQATAFPPNFIHSLDATHMLKTAIECAYRGLMFAAVHDSYWTHACDIDEMSNVIRDTFIDLHSSDVLKRLDDEFRARYADHKVPVVSAKAAAFMKSHAGAAEDGDALYAAEDVKLDELKGDDLDLTSAASDFTRAKRSAEQKKGVVDEYAEAEEEDEEAGLPGEDGDAELHVQDPVEGEAVLKDAPDAIGAELEDAADGDARQRRAEVQQLLNTEKKGKAAKKDKEALPSPEELHGKFVDLVDLLPQLPKKGEFDVSKIKQSLYFFS